MKTIRIEDQTHIELSKVKGELTIRNGKTKSYDNVITELILLWRKKEKKHIL